MKHSAKQCINQFRFIKNLACIVLLMVFFNISVSAQKNDTIYLLNGDRITGDLKKLDYGLVYLKTDAMQSINIEYDQIYSIYSSKFFEFSTSVGYRFFGSIGRSNVPNTINIITVNDTIPKPLADIVQITSIKKSFLQKIDGSVDMGLSYTKASDVFLYNLATSVTHRTPKFETKFNLSSILTDQKNLISRKNDIGLDITKFLPKKWSVGFTVKGQQNTELDLQHRLQGGIGAGYDLVRTNSKRFFSVIGLLGNNEQTIDSAYSSYNIEGLLSLQYKWFKYRHPKIDVNSGLNFYPSFSVPGRIRLDYELNAKFEIVTDLFFSISLYDNYDSKHSGSDSARNDWGVITSIGYSF